MPLEVHAQALLATRLAAGWREISQLTPAEAREQECSTSPDKIALAEKQGLRFVTFPAGDRTVSAIVIEPDQQPAGSVLFFHGGGWVVGAPDDYVGVMRYLSRQTGCTVVLPDYHKAPEHPFPAAVEDAIAAYSWICQAYSNAYCEEMPVVVMGESAGGNLAAVLAQHCKLLRWSNPALQILVYPVLDCDFETASYRNPDNQLLLTRSAMKWFWDQYLPDPALRLDPKASPLRQTSLEGLAPALIQLAEHDVLRNEAERYAQRLEAAGVVVRLEVFQGQMHGFLNNFEALPASRLAIDMAAQEIASRLSNEPASTDWPDCRK